MASYSSFEERKTYTSQHLFLHIRKPAEDRNQAKVASSTPCSFLVHQLKIPHLHYFREIVQQVHISFREEARNEESADDIHSHYNVTVHLNFVVSPC